MVKQSILQTTVSLSIVFCLASQLAAGAKCQKLETQKILVNASPECVFQALRVERDAPECHRKTIAFDGKVATIDETSENIPVFGQVHCIWEETEFPPAKMDYKMITSNHYKAAFGSWVIVPSDCKTKTVLELRSSIDAGLHFPLSDQITRMGASKDAKERLVRIKNIAERLASKPNQTIISSTSQSK